MMSTDKRKIIGDKAPMTPPKPAGAEYVCVGRDVLESAIAATLSYWAVAEQHPINNQKAREIVDEALAASPRPALPGSGQDVVNEAAKIICEKWPFGSCVQTTEHDREVCTHANCHAYELASNLNAAGLLKGAEGSGIPAHLCEDGSPLVTDLIFEVDRAVRQAGGTKQYDTVLHHILKKHLRPVADSGDAGKLRWKTKHDDEGSWFICRADNDEVIAAAVNVFGASAIVRAHNEALALPASSGQVDGPCPECSWPKGDGSGRGCTKCGIPASIPAPVVDREAVKLFRDHYWDTLEPHKDLILKHIESVLVLLPVGTGDAEAVRFIRNLDCECDAYHGHTCARCKFLADREGK